MSALLCAATLSAQYPYRATDPADPIYFDGKTVIYHTDTITLGPRTFFIDGSLPDTISRVYPYVYTSVQEAVGHLTPGTAEAPMKLYFAPWVYWVDDPDDRRCDGRSRAAHPMALSYVATGCISKGSPMTRRKWSWRATGGRRWER